MRHARPALAGATLLSTVVALAGAVALGAPASATVDGSDLTTCTTQGSGLHNGISSSDNGTAVVVGGDYVAHSAAAESEGRLVVAGTTTFDAGMFNVGRAGVGSGIVPLGDVVVSGGDITVATGTTLDVNHGVTGGGDLRTGGVVTNDGTIRLNGGQQFESDAAASGIAATHVATLRAVSAELGALAPTGTVTLGASTILRGDGSSDPQVFSVDASNSADLTEVTFTNVGDASIVINVSGTDAFLDSNYVAAQIADKTVRIDDGAPLGTWAPRILWNFTEATSVKLSTSSQLVGSILAPRADVVQNAHTNGRLWVGGDLDFGRSGGGLEHHNYPWNGLTETTCEPGTTVPDPEPEPSTDPSEPAEETTPTPESSEPVEEPTEEPSQSPTPETSEAPSTVAPTTPVDEDGNTPREQTVADGTDVETVADGGEQLPRTGSSVGVLLAVVGGLLAAGAGVLIWRRRLTTR